MSSPEQRRPPTPPPRVHLGRLILGIWCISLSLIGATAAGWFLVRLSIAEADKRAAVLDAEGRVAAAAIDRAAK